ncbi:MAG: hypothetical protein WKF76_10315 [Nocardioidaceae bacterium]
MAADTASIEAAILALDADILALAGVRSHDDFLPVAAGVGRRPGRACRSCPGARWYRSVWWRRTSPRLSVIEADPAPVSEGGDPDVGHGGDRREPGRRSGIDWEALRELLLKGPGLVTEDYWDEPSWMPRTRTQGNSLPCWWPCWSRSHSWPASATCAIAGLAHPLVSPGASNDWRRLRSDSDGWIPITSPLWQTGTGTELPPPSTI